MNRFKISHTCICAWTQWETPDLEGVVTMLERSIDLCKCSDHEISVFDEVKEKKYYLNSFDLENSIKKVLVY